MLVAAIRKEIDMIEEGRLDDKVNPLKVTNKNKNNTCQTKRDVGL